MDMFMFLTKECNFRCRYCYVPFSTEKMDRKTIDRTVELVRDEDVLSMFGGEPMLEVETIKYIVGKLDERGVKTGIKLFTNGSLFDESLAALLAETNRDVMVQVSYDGKNQSETGGKGIQAIETTIKRYLEVFKGKHRKVVHAETTIAPGYASGTADGIKFMYGLGVRSFGLVPVVEMPWSEEHAKEYFDDMKKTAEFVAQTYRNHDPAFAFPISLERLNNRDVFGCGAGKETVTIGTDGTIWRCHRYYAEFAGKDDRYQIGNIHEISDIRSFYESLDIAVYLKDMPKCNVCEDKQFCTKCHYANVKCTGDERTPPDNGFCLIPRINRILNEATVETLAREGVPRFLKQLGDILSGALGEPARKSYTTEDVTELSQRIVDANSRYAQNS